MQNSPEQLLLWGLVELKQVCTWHFPEHFENAGRTIFNLSTANPTKWLNNSENSFAVADKCLSLFDHFVGLALKGLKTNLGGYFCID